MLDQMLPGAELAGHVAAARRGGLAALSDDELCGAIAASRRLASWQAEFELAAITELDGRRGGCGGRPGDHVDAEIAALLTLTGRAAEALTGLARDLGRLPLTSALLAAGIIDRPRAVVMARLLAVLPDEDAAAVEAVVAPRAGQMTTGRLGAALARAVKAHDPEAAQRRREKAQKDARVEVWAEPAGTAALAGRDLAPAGVIEADKSLDADARWLRARGAAGTHDELRAAAYLARLTSRPLTSLTPNPSATGAASQGPGRGIPGAPGPEKRRGRGREPADGTQDRPVPGTGDRPGPGGETATAGGTGPRLGGTVHLTMPATTWLGLTDLPGDVPGTGPIDAGTGRDLARTLAANPATTWCLTLTDPAGRATAHGCARAGPAPPQATRPPAPPQATRPPAPPQATRPPAPPRATGPPAPPASPGATGPPGTSTPTAASGPPETGRPDGPGPPGRDGASRNGTSRDGDRAGRIAWLATITMTRIATGTCGHRHESAGYQPSPSLRHLVKTRSPRCGYPGCRRPAGRCDDDHTIPHHHGGRTCECNLHPLCRHHHQVKQAPRWHLAQPQPGVLTWTTPSGRTYTTTAEPYPA